jgi:tetratricopeptide (TPR) repeat protein
MNFIFQKIIIATLLLFLVFFVNAQTDILDNYINRLRLSQASGGSETAFLSTGSDFLYGQDYFDAGNYSSAAGYFQGIIRKEKDHPYANYQLAVSLLKQNDAEKAKLAQIHLASAFKALPALKERYQKDMPEATAAPNKPISNTSGKPKNNGVPPKTPTVEKKGLDSYIEKIKHSRSTGGAATAMLTPGLDAFYGIEYFEKGEFRSAETNFGLSLANDATNPYVNYLQAVSLAAQGKTNEAKPFLAKATAGDASLANRFAKDAATAAKKWDKQKTANAIKSSPSKPVKYGGSLLFGNYTCHVSVWNGPNVSPDYRYDYKGYFALKKDGSYRWLDDGATGKYTYDAATGELKWLSGHFKGYKPKITQYQPGNKTAQITITFSDNNRWECGCDR